MSGNGKLILKFAGSEQVKDYTDYKIIVKDANNETWQLRARYKRLRVLYEELKEKHGKDQLPRFPPKKYLWNSGSDFVMQRQKGLENFFNNVLRQYRMDELQSIIDFLYEGKDNKNGKGDKNGKDGGNEHGNGQNGEGTGKKGEKARIDNRNIEKIIQEYKDQFFDLSDNFDAREDMDNGKKREMYKLHINMGELDHGWKLPKGSESNLTIIHDSTVVASNSELGNLMGLTLDRMRQGIDSIDLIKGTEIVVNV